MSEVTSGVTTFVGWALVHFLWQGSVIALAVAVALRWIERPEVRYLVTCLGLAAMLAAPVATLATLNAMTRQFGAPTQIATESRSSPAQERGVTPGVSIGAPLGSDSRPPVLPFMTGIVVCWLAGVAVLFARLAAGWRQVKRLHAIAASQPSSRWLAACERMARVMGLARVPHVVDSMLVDVPTVVGWLRPVILLPVAALANLTPEQVESILAHELAHVRRHDYFVNLLQTLAETLLFYHPAVWWLSARVRAEREVCCDESAVAICGDAAGYARALVELENWRVSSSTMALAATGGSLFDRVRRIMRAPVAGAPRLSGWVVTAALTMLFTAGAGAVDWFPFSRTNDPGAAVMAPDVAQSPAGARQFTVAEAPDPPEPPEAPDPPEPPEAPQQYLEPRTPRDPREPRAPREPRGPRPPRPPVRPSTWSSNDVDFTMDTSHVCFGFPCAGGAEVRGRGEITFTPDLTDVESLSDGGYLILRNWTLFVPRTIEIHSEGGKLTRGYYVLGVSRPYDNEARKWLARWLPWLVRRSGVGAAARTKQILSARGVTGVLDEIKRLESDHARSVYFRELFKAAPFDAPTAQSALTLARHVLSSDFELSRTLRMLAPAAAADPALVRTYVDATNAISSDFEHRRALMALLVAPPSAETSNLILQSIGRMGSDFEKSNVLRTVLTSSTPDRPDLFVGAVRGIGSDFEKRRVLSTVLMRKDLTLDMKRAVLTAAASLGSDFECSNVLRSYVNQYGVEPAASDAFFSAVGRVGSDFERSRILMTVIHAAGMDPSIRSAVIRSAGQIGSSHHQNQIFAALVKTERR